MKNRKDMRVLFVITNVNGTYGDAYSIGLAAIAAITKQEGYDYQYDLVYEAEQLDDFVDRVRKFKPRVIAYTAVSSQYMFVKRLSKEVRNTFGDSILQVCGGVHPTIYPDCLLEAKGLDGLFIGEGEYGFRDFLDRVYNGQPYLDVKNYAYVKDGKVVQNLKYPLIEKLDELPFIERERYGYENFVAKDGYAMFFFSRGCPFICTYCSNHALASAYGMITYRPRYRSPRNCIEEIKSVAAKYDFKRVFVGDDTFGINKKWMREFCELYGKEIKLPLIIQLRVNLVNEEMLKCLKSAGCAHVSCGVEAGNPHIRNKIMKRNLSDKQIIDAYALFKKFGITANAINMIGMPSETEETIWETIRLNRLIKPDSSGVNIFYPYRGTVLADYCVKHGLINEAAYEDFSRERRESILNFSPEFKDKLVYYHRNWQNLVYRNQPLKLSRILIKKYMEKYFPSAWEGLRAVKRRFTPGGSKADQGSLGHVSNG